MDKWDYFNNPSQEFERYFCLRFLWILSKTGLQNWRSPIFLRFNLIKKKTVWAVSSWGWSYKTKDIEIVHQMQKKSNLTRLGFYVVWENVLNTPKLSIFACPDWIELDALRPLGKLSESRIYRNWVKDTSRFVDILIFG